MKTQVITFTILIIAAMMFVQPYSASGYSGISLRGSYSSGNNSYASDYRQIVYPYSDHGYSSGFTTYYNPFYYTAFGFNNYGVSLTIRNGVYYPTYRSAMLFSNHYVYPRNYMCVNDNYRNVYYHRYPSIPVVRGDSYRRDNRFSSRSRYEDTRSSSRISINDSGRSNDSLTNNRPDNDRIPATSRSINSFSTPSRSSSFTPNRSFSTSRNSSSRPGGGFSSISRPGSDRPSGGFSSIRTPGSDRPIGGFSSIGRPGIDTPSNRGTSSQRSSGPGSNGRR